MSNIISAKESYLTAFGELINPLISQYTVITSNGHKLLVPKNEDNVDYRNLLEWVAEGNTIEPADE